MSKKSYSEMDNTSWTYSNWNYIRVLPLGVYIHPCILTSFSCTSFMRTSTLKHAMNLTYLRKTLSSLNNQLWIKEFQFFLCKHLVKPCFSPWSHCPIYITLNQFNVFMDCLNPSSGSWPSDLFSVDMTDPPCGQRSQRRQTVTDRSHRASSLKPMCTVS